MYISTYIYVYEYKHIYVNTYILGSQSMSSAFPLGSKTRPNSPEKRSPNANSLIHGRLSSSKGIYVYVCVSVLYVYICICMCVCIVCICMYVYKCM
jgi:hypothetical protein